jgi:hypothetical protein
MKSAVGGTHFLRKESDGMAVRTTEKLARDHPLSRATKEHFFFVLLREKLYIH